MRTFLVVLEGLPAMGKTTLANLMRDSLGFTKVNESLGYLPETEGECDQRQVFEETCEKYGLASRADGLSVIDRGYPSMLGWDYCSDRMFGTSQFEEKAAWVHEALRNGRLREPDIYLYLRGEPELSLARRPRLAHEGEVWSDRRGMGLFTEFYDGFFAPTGGAACLRLDASRPSSALVENVRSLLI